eukprot:2658006-Rhodomonas_salina.4
MNEYQPAARGTRVEPRTGAPGIWLDLQIVQCTRVLVHACTPSFRVPCTSGLYAYPRIVP